MTSKRTSIVADGPVLIFGGPYSNLQATQSVLAEATRLGIPRDRIICTGDMAAYCGDPVATIDFVRESRIHVVMGNCDEQLAKGAGDCGCGFPSDSLCERLSSAWFKHANSVARQDQRTWLGSLPGRIDLELGGRRLAIIHGSLSVINRFVFATTPTTIKRSELELSEADGVIGGHCGLPFTEIIDGKLWHNAGVIGMPANDGTSRVWFSTLTPGKAGLNIEHRAISYDHAVAASAMRYAGLPSEYRVALASGIWPSCDVLPARETREQGVPMEPGSVMWKAVAKPARSKKKPEKPETKLLWPELLAAEGTAPALAELQKMAIPTDDCCAPTSLSVQPLAASCCAPSNSTATRDLYRDAALSPDAALCCATNPVWQLPELRVPPKMLEMNYGCGSTVHPGDLARSPTVLYVGVGGGLEVLQFAYFSRRRGAVIGLDVVDEMMAACRRNLEDAEEQNPWFKQSFIDLRKGDALSLPIADASIDVAAQNCLFNIFHDDDQRRALSEMSRVLKPGGKLILSDPICETAMPEALRRDERLRSMCLTGAIPLNDYIARLAQAGFGTIEVRARKPYRVLGPGQYATHQPILLESVEICAIKSPVVMDGPTVYAGQTAIYYGGDDAFSDGKEIHLPSNQPVPISMRDAGKLKRLGRSDIYVSEPSWSHAAASGCC
jgi:SAM-dependent methyltransferase/predicted phosphodiesterase